MVTTRIPDLDAPWLVVGQLVDKRTRQGIAGALVEVRELDTRYDDMLGQPITGEQGEFLCGFTPEDWGDFAQDRAPDLYFLVYIDGVLALDTKATPMLNVPRGRIPVTLELERGTLPEAKEDRVNVEQLLRMADWWRASDFKGVFGEGRSKVGTLSAAIARPLTRRFKAWDFEPVRPGATKEKAIVEQPVLQAQTTLAAQQVQVAEVRTAEARTTGTLRVLAKAPLELKAGDRVVLYQEDGVVRYYARAEEPAIASIDQQAVAALDQDVKALQTQAQGVDTLRAEMAELRSADQASAERLEASRQALAAREAELTALRRELDALRQVSVEKDQVLTQMRSDLVALRGAQDQLAARLPVQRLEVLEQQVRLIGVPRSAKAAPRARAAQSPSTVQGPALAPTPKPGATRKRAKPDSGR
jgi:hypothetical protein